MEYTDWRCSLGCWCSHDCSLCHVAGQRPRHEVISHHPELPASPGHGDPLRGLRGDSPQELRLPAARRDRRELVTPGGVEGAAGAAFRTFDPEAVVRPQPSASPIIERLPMQFSR